MFALETQAATILTHAELRDELPSFLRIGYLVEDP